MARQNNRHGSPVLNKHTQHLYSSAQDINQAGRSRPPDGTQPKITALANQWQRRMLQIQEKRPITHSLKRRLNLSI